MYPIDKLLALLFGAVIGGFFVARLVIMGLQSLGLWCK